jgi:mRNA interferase YafQ
MLTIKLTKQFKKDDKKLSKRDQSLLDDIIDRLANGENLTAPPIRDHALNNSKRYKDCRECHVKPDLLLIYKIISGELILECVRTGSHSDLFSTRFIGRVGNPRITRRKKYVKSIVISGRED